MNRLGFKSSVYQNDVYLGELQTVPYGNWRFPNNQIRIDHITISDRCLPLHILHTIGSFRCKLDPCPDGTPYTEASPLIQLHASCFYDRKTGVVLLDNEEIHLVAMPSKEKQFPCFWCYSVPRRLYSQCLWMLNTRCLAIVFDLDETLIVANTLKSFEDRIDALIGWIARENDPIRESGMTAEMKRYVEDRALLKQYAENDCVIDGGKVYNMQKEEVPVTSDGQECVLRPVVRLPEKNVVLTRINPENRDTSVLVRLRPAWEDLKHYLFNKGRRRFEVYVCTMAERDYALEMWRLLDPEAHLISTKQLLNRVVCVKSGSRKSLLNVFKDGDCHPKMAMVIDDRLKVWEEKDQPRVHVVPAFTPYYAPQAEMANAVPVLCVARNVACNVRGGFFKEFDDDLWKRISEIFHEDDLVNLPCGPDVSNYLISEDASFIPNSNANVPVAEGMNAAEVGQRLNCLEETNVGRTSSHTMSSNLERRSEDSELPVTSFASSASASTRAPLEKPGFRGDPSRRGGKFSAELPMPPKAHNLQPQGGWLVEESSRGHLGFQATTTFPEHGPSDRFRDRQNSLSHGTSSSVPGGLMQAPQEKKEEYRSGHETRKTGFLLPDQPAEFGLSQRPPSASMKEFKSESDKMNLVPSLYIAALQEIGRRCSSKVEFRPVVSISNDLQFSVEVFFSGERIGVGMGKTRKDAQQQAADNALRSLAGTYISYIAPTLETIDKDEKCVPEKDNGFLYDVGKPESGELSVIHGFSKQNISGCRDLDNTSRS